MIETKAKFFLSQPRLAAYLIAANHDFNKAYRLYQLNIELSVAFYPVLAVLEISLRNAIHERMKIHFNDDFWFKNKLPYEFQPYVADAINKVIAQKKNATHDRIIAELNFGFWTRLFNRHHTNLLWKPLRIIFNNIPKHLKQRDTIDDVLYRIRTLRNKIYHYESIFHNLNEIELLYVEMLTFLTWLDNDLPEILNDIDHFKEIYSKAITIRLP